MSGCWSARRILGAGAWTALLAGLLSLMYSSVVSAAQPITRHPLETRALVDPQGVLQELPELLRVAAAAKNSRELALLHLSQANACRVIADWPCQRDAGARARAAAEAAGLPELQVRGLIAESRGRLTMQDFTRGERLLGDAERILELHPYPELKADVFLAYSSLSYFLGKHALAAEYAAHGLAALGDKPALTIRIRLLRNLANARAQLGDTAQAKASVKQGLALVDQIKDPKLSAELHLEDARIAHLEGDVQTQMADGLAILALARQLSNSQLTGLGHEVLGLAALDHGNSETAERELRLAYGSFNKLKLQRDERRVLRALVNRLFGRARPPADLETLMARLIKLEKSLESDDHKLAADDFDARLKYAQQNFEVQRLEAAAALSAQREAAFADQQRFSRIIAALSIGLVLVMGGFFLSQRRFSARLQQVITQLRESEGRYRMLAENSRDLVVRMRPDGERLYVSPAAKDLLGLDPSEMAFTRWDLVHPDDRDKLMSALRELGEDGGQATIVYRALHTNGEYVWIEALGRLIAHPDGGGPPEIIYSGRDITARVRAEQALSMSEKRMRAVTDNIPALIAQLDKEERYLFANAFVGRVFGIEPSTMLHKTVREIRGDAIYADLKPQIDAALRGETVSFEGKAEVGGRTYHYQSNYVPDFDADGQVQGFYSFTFDITALKAAEAELDHLARIDSLTGVSNRRDFEERLATTIARSRRHREPIALLCLDIDNFKEINDEHGHPGGDAVLVEFARRLQTSVREDDLVARLGGDEFIVLIENPGPDSPEIVAGKLLTVMREPMQVGEIKVKVTASIGVVHSPGALNSQVLMSLADKALYAAKAAGRDTWVLGE